MSEKKYKIKPSSEVHAELIELESPLANMNSEVRHQVPEGYWAKEEYAILRQLESQEKQSSDTSNIRKLWPWVIGIAASLAIAVVLFVSQEEDAGLNEEEFLGNIEFSEIESYILDESEFLYGSEELEAAY